MGDGADVEGQVYLRVFFRFASRSCVRMFVYGKNVSCLARRAGACMCPRLVTLQFPTFNAISWT